MKNIIVTLIVGIIMMIDLIVLFVIGNIGPLTATLMTIPFPLFGILVMMAILDFPDYRSMFHNKVLNVFCIIVAATFACGVIYILKNWFTTHGDVPGSIIAFLGCMLCILACTITMGARNLWFIYRREQAERNHHNDTTV